MALDQAVDTALYVYGVVPAEHARDPIRIAGLHGAAVETVVSGPLAALVSHTSAGTVRPSRANLSAHQDVVAAAHEHGPVVPVGFGTVMTDAGAVVTELLEPGAGWLDHSLRSFKEKDEWRVRTRYLPDAALREVVASSPGIRRLRDEVSDDGGGGIDVLRMRLGEMVAAELIQLRERDAEAVLRTVQPHALDLVALPSGSDDVVLYLAALVDRRNASALDQALASMAESQSGRLAFELTGPLPPWDFSEPAEGVV